MNSIEAFVRNPVKVCVGVILLALFGTLALYSMPMQLTPEVEIPTLTIETSWPGASPQEVESEIIQEQEEQLQSVEGVTKMTSESMDSVGRITLEFAVGADISQALLLVNTRLQQVREYPENADEPVITTSNSANQFIAWFIINQRTPSKDELDAFAEKNPQWSAALDPVRQAHNAGLALFRLKELAAREPAFQPLLPPDNDVTKMRRFAEDFIEARFERVEGVSNSNVIGGREEEMQVVVDPQRLAARRLTIADVRRALSGQNKDTSGGDFWEGKRRYVVRTLGKFRSPDDVASAILARRDGSPVYVGDVAEVRLGYKKPDGLVQRFGSEVIAVNASRDTGANVLDVMKGLRHAVAELNEGALKQQGLELRQVYDETEYIYSSINLVNDNIVEAAVLTFICLMLFLRSVRSSVVIFLSISVSIIGMFLFMRLMGRSLNVLSLAGIAFAVGMLVDNFIVVLENIYRHYQTGEDAMTATVKGTKEVWGAVLASTLANLAVFLPVIFVQDQAGQLFRDIALAASSALVVSLLVSLTVVPTAAFRLLPARSAAIDANGHGDPQQAFAKSRAQRAGAGPGRLRSLAERAQTGLAAITRTVLWPIDAFGRAFVRTVVGINGYLQLGVLRQVAVVFLFVGVSLGLIWVMLPKVEYLPTGNRNLVIGLMLPPPGYNLDHMRKMGTQMEARLRPYWDVDIAVTGEANLDHPAIEDFFYVARGRQLFIGVRAQNPLKAAGLIPLLREVTADMPGVFMVAAQRSLFEQGLTAGRTVDVEVSGPDIRKLVALGGQIMGQVREVVAVDVQQNGKKTREPPQARPNPSLDLSSPEMHIVPKWQHAADMGVSADELGYTVDALVDGAYAGDYFLGGDKIDLTIMGHEQFAARTQDLQALSLAVPTGELVSLAAVADVRYSSGPEQVNHRERQRAITIEVTPPLAMAMEDAMDVIQQQIVVPMEQGDQLEGGYQIKLSGTADKLRATWIVLRWNLALAVVITYLLMAALFESWIYPLVIILSVPLGAVGGFAGLKLLNVFVLQQLDVMTMLGFIILVGTVVNNPILIVEQALVHIREEGMAPRRAVLESVRTRIRPIFMTAMIGLFGLLPLVVSPGAGSELYRGLGSVVLGGLVVSTIFTLVLVPTLFSLTLEAREAVARTIRGQPPRPPRQPAIDEPQQVVSTPSS
ncbi:MAG: efflux RND transporter permease subunit [Pirellulales bacterium]